MKKLLLLTAFLIGDASGVNLSKIKEREVCYIPSINTVTTKIQSGKPKTTRSFEDLPYVGISYIKSIGIDVPDDLYSCRYNLRSNNQVIYYFDEKKLIVIYEFELHDRKGISPTSNVWTGKRLFDYTSAAQANKDVSNTINQTIKIFVDTWRTAHSK